MRCCATCVGEIDDEFDIDAEQLVHREDGELRLE
jgi:hypothetical protein